MENWAKVVAIAVIFVVGYGVMVGVFNGGFPAMAKVGLSSGWSWWQYALAVPIMGFLALGAEAVGELVIAPFLAWRRKDQPGWKRAVFFLTVLAIILGGLVWVFAFQE